MLSNGSSCYCLVFFAVCDYTLCKQRGTKYTRNEHLFPSSASPFSGTEPMAGAARTAVRDAYLDIGSWQETVMKYSGSERICDTTARVATLITLLSLAQKRKLHRLLFTLSRNS